MAEKLGPEVTDLSNAYHFSTKEIARRLQKFLLSIKSRRMVLNTIKVEVIEGQVVIPDEIMAVLGIRPGDGVEVFLDGDAIILQKNALNLVH